MKPKPCQGCGFCCTKAPCGIIVYRELPPPWRGCPELVWDPEANRYWCGLVFAGRHDPEWVAEELYFGAGCCAPLNSLRRR